MNENSGCFTKTIIASDPIASRVAATRAVVDAARVLRKEHITDSYVSCCAAWDALDRALADLDAVS
jgi:hypothetical protein